MIHSDRRTKIVCTIGPSSNTYEKITELAQAGMNVVRLNFSHGTHDDHKKVIETIRAVAKKNWIQFTYTHGSTRSKDPSWTNERRRTTHSG